MDSELLLKKSSPKLVDKIEIYIEFLTEEWFEEPTSDPYNIVSKVKESIMVARIRLIRRVSNMVSTSLSHKVF